MASLDSLTALPGHTRIADDVTLLSPDIDRSRLLSSAQITDTYLAQLAYAHAAQLATFDRRISLAAIPHAGDMLLQIPA